MAKLPTVTRAWLARPETGARTSVKDRLSFAVATAASAACTSAALCAVRRAASRVPAGDGVIVDHRLGAFIADGF